MAIRNDVRHVSDVMAEALSHLNRVVEHLRGEGENEAANGIARGVHSMLDTFNHTTAPWEMEKFQMKPVPAERTQQITHARITTPADARPHTSTWAAVAATDIPRNNRLVKFGPSDGLKRQITEDEVPVQARDEDFRCVWIYGWSKDKPLSMVTERISSGAIFSMVYVSEYEAVCVIFQHASAAMVLVDDNSRSLRDGGLGLFGQGNQVKFGEAYPENANLQRMAPPINERRRLTFARQQLFTNGMSEERFKRDLIELVGRHNIELVWLFNTGNATVVFSSTVIARIVRDDFLRRSRNGGPYQDIQIGFSHDPCERPMNLITQIPYTGSGPRDRSDSGKSASSGRSYNPNAPKFGRKGTDSDGWQTVLRKR
ncbi:uncharacterized protein Z518_05343 [Rhinocladiella mackenziei CBS 650.93]|uniref:Rhinocladiella mackenziei CBS 650.93 unplaced genomic scaffold supercont1.4, whole genome shotgun sequence n=1 Tax=Rhinocladiella mackenziei CBS 650.93 TaxID=1442369 RepID=A0A0D2H242_9EURO|nr:uncharacterized protein Z518_05343 [Rhinocladiella mackenziei CBS 650.93]KIX04473.1 hypothetical protein Z518_05343 [Rhinocladiella mackenziei CBS 650.93]